MKDCTKSHEPNQETVEAINEANNMYFYSEGFVYKARLTICNVFGTEKEQEEIGTRIAEA